MAELIFTIIFAIVAIGAGWSIVHRLDPVGRLLSGERIGLAFVIGCMVVNFGVAFIGPWRLDTVSMGALAATMVLLSISGLKSMPWRIISAAITAERVACKGDHWLLALWLAVISIGVGTLLQGLAPPNDYDSLMYHLTLPRYDVELGRMDIPWDRRIEQILMPAFGGNLSRLVLTLSDDGAAQMVHGLFGPLTALGSAMLALRIGYSKAVALLAAIMFLSVRATIWEMASVETDVLLAAAMILSFLVYREWRKEPTVGLGVLFGLMIGTAILIKLHGFVLAVAFTPLIIFDMASNRRAILKAFIGPAVALVVITPHLIRTYILTGNPLFPMFNDIIVPGAPAFLTDFSTSYGTGQGIIDLLISPWTTSILPMHYFDGMVLGAPYLLALSPMILLAPDKRRWLPILVVLGIYYVIWFYFLSQQVRFLLHVAPLIAVMAGAGAFHLWQHARQTVWMKWVFIAVVTVLAFNQGAFVGIYAALRLPPAIGLVSDAAFHDKTPTLNGAHFKTCTFIANNLKPDETYFSDLGAFVSYYCPQTRVVSVVFPEEARDSLLTKRTKPFTLAEFTGRVEKAGFRFFMTRKAIENRRNLSGHSLVTKQAATNSRFGKYLWPAFDQLTPLSEGPYTAVYDGAKVIRLLRKASGNVP